MQINLTARKGATVAACVALGSAGGIVGSMAAPTKHRAHSSRQATRHQAGPPPFMVHGHGGPPVHAEEVILNRAGTDFITETEDNGVVKSVDGHNVTITEGTHDVTYRDVTVTIPADAKIMRNGAIATVTDLKHGDHIHISRSSDGTLVFADDSSFRPPLHEGWHDGPRGPGEPYGDVPPPPVG